MGADTHYACSGCLIAPTSLAEVDAKSSTQSPNILALSAVDGRRNFVSNTFWKGNKNGNID